MSYSLTIISFRLSENDRVLLEQVAQSRGKTKSVIIRRAIKTELAKLGQYGVFERRALGVA